MKPVRILDLAGRTVLQVPFKANEEIDISSLQKGVYLLQLHFNKFTNQHQINQRIMKKFILLTLVVSTAFALKADFRNDTIRNKKNGGYFFSEITNIDHNIVQNQCRTGTCWSFSSLSFFESELIRMGKPKVNLSEMFIVRGAYLEKARNYIRMDGLFNFGQGGAFHDILVTMDKYGIVPESEYNGLQYGTDKHNHSEMSTMLKGMLDAVKKKPQGGKLTPNWMAAVEGTVEAYLGEAPEKFTFEGTRIHPNYI